MTIMIEVPIYNQEGTKVDTFQLDEQKLGGEVKVNLLKQAVTMYHANQRQGTVQTQARGEVAGSTRKLFKQKGTGNARTGGIRNPIKVGGGHAKQKRPKEWRQAMPNKGPRPAGNSAVLSELNAWDILRNRTLLVTREGLEQILNGTEKGEKKTDEKKTDEPATTAS